MDSIISTWITEIENRCKNQNIDIKDCLIMFRRNQTYFNGEIISGFTESKNGRWICIPVYNDELSDISDEYVYCPQCFKIQDKMTTYLSDGAITALTTIWLLRKP